jgi:predicted amidohydrolase YtcJ
VIAVLVLLVGSAVHAATQADTIYINGHVYTVDEAHPWAQAMAVRGDRFVFVGDESRARELEGPSTKIVDLHGRTVMPGIHDAHSHMLWAGLAANFGCHLPGGPFGDPQLTALRKCAAGLRPGEWMVAGPFTTDQFPGGKPDRKILDDAFPDRPVYLNEVTEHNGLANARALELAGINASSVNPPGGVIVRAADGSPTGELIESATGAVRRRVPPPTPAQVRTALDWAVRTCNRFGITSLQEATGDEILLKGLHAMDSRGALTLDVAVHLMWGSRSFQRTDDAQVLDLIARRGMYRSTHVDVDNIKIWVDGTPTPPYFTEGEFDRATHEPDPAHVLVSPADLRAAVQRFDAQGLRVKMHVAGPGAARVALDAIAAARAANPRSSRRHELAHTNLITPQDMDRMKKLNATAELSPAVWQIYGSQLGNPPQSAWQFKSLAGRGMLMTVGTDWPVTEDPNLFPALQGMLEHGDESVDLARAVQMYTLNGAIAGDNERDRGSIQVGKQANFIVLDRDVFSVPRAQIGPTKVVTTVFEGRVVYSATP